MVRDIPDHPEIARCLETGYPNLPNTKAIRCDDCEKDMDDNDTLYIWEGRHICGECLKECIEEAYPIETLAEELNIDWVKAYLLKED